MVERVALRVLAACAAVLLCAPAARAQAGLADATQMIQQQDANLGSGAGNVVLDRPARLGASVTLGAGHNLLVQAPLTVGAATITLAGHNNVQCSAPVTVENAVDLFVAQGVTDIGVQNCHVTVTGRAGGYLLTATRSARVNETGDQAVDMALFNTHNGTGAPGQATTDVTITGSSTDFPHGGGPIGVYLLYVIGGTVTNNKFHGTGHGVQWWGGDANQGWPGFDKVTGAGKLTISGNQCDNAGGSCVWGSDGFDITVTHNTAVGCGDVCFDTEGGVRTTFTNNSARTCGNGCFAAEFESQNATFTGNTGYADNKEKAAALVLIKHPSGRGPTHENLNVSGNTLTCGDPCTALYTEGEGGFTFSNNKISNGITVFINYTNNVTMKGNSLLFTAVPGGNWGALNGPMLANGHTSEISGNTVVNKAPGAPSGTCISQGWSDYNSTDTMRITGNTCTGFATGIFTISSGGNPGAPHAVWMLQGNQFVNVPAGKQIVHTKTSGNEVYTAR